MKENTNARCHLKDVQTREKKTFLAAHRVVHAKAAQRSCSRALPLALHVPEGIATSLCRKLSQEFIFLNSFQVDFQQIFTQSQAGYVMCLYLSPNL